MFVCCFPLLSSFDDTKIRFFSIYPQNIRIYYKTIFNLLRKRLYINAFNKIVMGVPFFVFPFLSVGLLNFF